MLHCWQRCQLSGNRARLLRHQSGRGCVPLIPHLPHAVKGVCLPGKANKLVAAARHTGGADRAGVQRQRGCIARCCSLRTQHRHNQGWCGWPNPTRVLPDLSVAYLSCNSCVLLTSKSAYAAAPVLRGVPAAGPSARISAHRPASVHPARSAPAQAPLPAAGCCELQGPGCGGLLRLRQHRPRHRAGSPAGRTVRRHPSSRFLQCVLGGLGPVTVC